jgi:Inner membrane protein YgaP-like, transmembrane domain
MTSIQGNRTMTFSTERIIRIFAGAVVMISLALGHFHSPYWYWLTAFAGFNLFQSGFTRFCPPEMLLNRLRGKQSAAVPQRTGRA